MFNLGHIQAVRPSLGSWLVYGLGAETDNLPGFVAMSPHAQARGKTANYSNSFLPGAYSGCYVNINSMHPDRIVSDLKNQYLSRGSQREQADLLAQLNQIDLRNQEQDAALESSIQAMSYPSIVNDSWTIRTPRSTRRRANKQPLAYWVGP